jgi:hypothetical protein
VTSGPQQATPVASSIPKTAVDHGIVYFARDGLPPIGVAVPGVANEVTREERIASRVNALNSGGPVGSRVVVPLGAFNAFPREDPALLRVSSVAVQGDTATVDVALPGTWRAFGPIQSVGLLKQLVYTITEEPGVRRAVVRQNGTVGSIDAAILWDRPLSREDVFGYGVIGPLGLGNAISAPGASLPPSGQRGTTTETLPGTSVKVTVQIGVDSAPANAPAFVAWMTEAPSDLQQLGKYILTIVVGGTSAPANWAGAQPQITDQTPLRATLTGTGAGEQMVLAYLLDDARPWRAYTDNGHVVVEIGGDPRLVSDRIAVGAPVYDAKVGPTFVLSGSGRVFEANVVWRVKDSSQKIVASGRTTASLGSSAVWGTFRTTVALPSSVAVGRLMLEVYEASPKDGSEQGLIAMPLNR